jgi:hypothetical protein
MKIHNVHQRRFTAPVSEVGALLDGLATSDDRLWPFEAWPPMVLDGGLRVGSRGGHGPVRYAVERCEPGRMVSFRFEPTGLTAGFDGHHTFVAVPDGDATVLRHAIDATAGLAAWTRWALLVRPLHDALLEDALDKAERSITGSVARPARWGPWVRVLRAMMRRRRRA